MIRTFNILFNSLIGYDNIMTAALLISHNISIKFEIIRHTFYVAFLSSFFKNNLYLLYVFSSLISLFIFPFVWRPITYITYKVRHISVHQYLGLFIMIRFFVLICLKFTWCKGCLWVISTHLKFLSNQQLVFPMFLWLVMWCLPNSFSGCGKIW